MKHIDAHIHLYPETLMNAIFSYFERRGWCLPFRSGTEEALVYLKERNVEKAFLLLYAHKAGMSWELNQWARDLCLQNPFLLPFGCFFPEDEEPEILVKTCLKDWNFAGFKLHFNVQVYRPDDSRFFPVYEGAINYGKAVVMHIGTFPTAGAHLGAERLLAVMKKYPELKVLVAHLGLYEVEDFWWIMDRYPGVYMDTAFLLGNPRFPQAGQQVLATMERFPDRVLYGSDFPLICHRLEDGFDEIETLFGNHIFKQKLLSQNAEAFLKS
ncbi:MAG: amidohydrolase [Clostridiales bacterium]|jgi:predicted TIM-barrel fold metal-dependent hydrolase|nr:amidohydrolase [Clostridiales bacterium]